MAYRLRHIWFLSVRLDSLFTAVETCYSFDSFNFIPYSSTFSLVLCDGRWAKRRCIQHYSLSRSLISFSNSHSLSFHCRNHFWKALSRRCIQFTESAMQLHSAGRMELMKWILFVTHKWQRWCCVFLFFAVAVPFNAHTPWIPSNFNDLFFFHSFFACFHFWTVSGGMLPFVSIRSGKLKIKIATQQHSLEQMTREGAGRMPSDEMIIINVNDDGVLEIAISCSYFNKMARRQVRFMSTNLLSCFLCANV